MPIGVERTTQKPHAEYDNRQMHLLKCIWVYTYPHKLSTVVSFLTPTESCEVPSRQERASSKRFLILTRPSRVARDRASALRPFRKGMPIKIIEQIFYEGLIQFFILQARPAHTPRQAVAPLHHPHLRHHRNPHLRPPPLRPQKG